MYGREERTITDESSAGGAGGHDMLTRLDIEGFPLGKTVIRSMNLNRLETVGTVM